MKFCDTCHSSYPNEFQTCPKDQAPLRAASELVQGMVIRDKYQVLEKIGAGGMAVVYKARHLAFNEIRALKLVSSRMLEDQDFLKRFKTEAVITRKLQHANAVRVDDIDTTEDGRPFIVMEYVAGQNLRAVIAQEGRVEVSRALKIAKQVALALGAAHRLGITHRDIKPDNILLVTQPDSSDLVKVLDFGIAKVREGAFDTGAGYTATQTGMVVGTPQYISPEQAMGKHGQEVDGRADLYSLGVVLYEMITGQLPFESDTPMGMLLHHIQTAPRPPHLLKPELNIPEPVSKLLMKALAKHPQDRFQSADEMYEALRHPREWIAASHAGTQATQVMGSPRHEEGVPTPPAAPVAPTTVVSPRAASPQPVAAAPAAPRPVAASRAAAPRRVPPAPTAGGAPWGRIAVVLLALALLGAGGYYVVGRRSAAAANTPVPAASPSPPVVQPAPVAGSPAGEDAAKPAASATPPAAQPEEPTSQVREARELIARGRAALDTGDYAGAIASFRQALQIDPGNAAAQAGLRRAQRARRAEAEVLGRRR
ncbi:MAG TPA: protein kinase [Terriglobales bacterium]|nr:protein kinase [Terriglobales bacterium]